MGEATATRLRRRLHRRQFRVQHLGRVLPGHTNNRCPSFNCTVSSRPCGSWSSASYCTDTTSVRRFGLSVRELPPTAGHIVRLLVRRSIGKARIDAPVSFSRGISDLGARLPGSTRLTFTPSGSISSPASPQRPRSHACSCCSAERRPDERMPEIELMVIMRPCEDAMSGKNAFERGTDRRHLRPSPVRNPLPSSPPADRLSRRPRC